ncbi:MULTISPECIES: hypothetical protein [unclassified Streptomyces]|uniref:hypothetical protein n=1 Tax=unclassified Streptomyces TaxID=2593676 RepID=UPI00278C8BB1|nr:MULTISPECIES: hypothetical protein [unclassified Streptomyces]
MPGGLWSYVSLAVGVALYAGMVMSHHGWARWFWAAVCVWAVSYQVRTIRSDRQAPARQRQAELERLDLLMRREVRRRR